MATAKPALPNDKPATAAPITVEAAAVVFYQKEAKILLDFKTLPDVNSRTFGSR